MRDMKGEIQEMAEDLAWEKRGCGFYDLPIQLQDKIWDMAVSKWNDQQADRADMLRKEENFVLRKRVK